MSRRLLRPTKQYLFGSADMLVWHRTVGGNIQQFPPEYIQKCHSHWMAEATREWTLSDGKRAKAGSRWDVDPTYFAPGGKGNQIREYRLPQRGRKTVRGKSKPTTDDLLDLI